MPPAGDSRNSAYAFTTNALGWVTAVDNYDSSTTGTAGVPRVVLYAKYDLNGNRTAFNAQVDVGSGLKDDFQNTYTFDRLNRETSVLQNASGNSGHYYVGYKKTTFGWDNDGRLQTLTDYKDSSTSAAYGNFAYDHDSRLTSLSWSGPGGGYGGGSGYFEQFAWSFDRESRVATFSNNSHTNENLTYDYDNDSQLKSAVASYGGYGGGYGGGTYGWDGNGDTTLSGWVTGKGNRLLSDGTYRYDYDKAGHVVKKTAISGGAYTEYGWDERGQMISVTDKNSSGVIQQKIDLWYDAFNDLIGRKVTPYSSGSPVTGSITTARFVYDVTGSGTPVLAFDKDQSLTDRYLWGPAVDEILADERYSPSGSNVMPTTTTGTVYWALTDNENTVRDWITYGSLVDHIIYDSFGKVVSHSNSSVPFAFGHNGVFYDPSSGLEWHSQPGTGIPGRWYNPATRRWMSEDPTGLSAGPDQYACCNTASAKWR